MDQHTTLPILEAGTTLVLAQPSVRRRAYELWRGDHVLGWLRFAAGRRSVARAEGTTTGALVLIAKPGWVEVRGGPKDAVIARVEPRSGGAVIRIVDAPLLRWHRTGWRQWSIADGEATLLSFTTAHGLLRSSAQITVRHELPQPTGVVLSLIGGFLAIRKLQAEIDGSAAAGGIVAAGAG
jgi:hypothetical protein